MMRNERQAEKKRLNSIRDDKTLKSSLFKVCQTTTHVHVFNPFAEPHGSVGSVADSRTGGRWFDPRLGQYFFRGLMIVIAIGFIPLSPLSIAWTMVMWESSQWLGKNIVRSTGFKNSMDRCTGHSNMTEILLKAALITIQSNNHSINLTPS